MDVFGIVRDDESWIRNVSLSSRVMVMLMGKSRGAFDHVSWWWPSKGK